MSTIPPLPVTPHEFALTVATVNGSGSQTSNMVLIRAVFALGIPVSGKNLLPSNIQGEPTWYTVRVSGAGYTARPPRSELLVAFNPQTAEHDLAQLPAGGVCIFSADSPWRPSRADVHPVAVPVAQLLAAADVPPRLRTYAASMTYVGVLAAICGLPDSALESALNRQLKGRASAVNLNLTLLRAARDWAATHVSHLTDYRLTPRPPGPQRMLIDGNSAAAIGALTAGVTVAAWYPITPATGLAEALIEYLPRLRPQQPEATCAIVQAEDEIAALGIVVGAGWAGARAMTSTSGPGISLMTEFAGLAFFAEIPAVIWDVQRVGPSTGLPTRTAQSDLLSTYFLGHGDTRQVILLPGTIEECFADARQAFDLAEQLQTPVFVLSDLDLGMNIWMSRPFDLPSEPLNRGKVLNAAQLSELAGYARFADVDGDGVGYRTLPGNPHPLAATLSRGTGHNARNQYSEKPQDWTENMARLWRKHDTARSLVPAPLCEDQPAAALGIICYGTSEPAVREARDQLAAAGLPTAALRVRALPFNDDVTAFIARYPHHLVVEQTHDGQLRQLLQLHAPAAAIRLHLFAQSDGLPLTAAAVAAAARACAVQAGLMTSEVPV